MTDTITRKRQHRVHLVTAANEAADRLEAVEQDLQQMEDNDLGHLGRFQVLIREQRALAKVFRDIEESIAQVDAELAELTA